MPILQIVARVIAGGGNALRSSRRRCDANGLRSKYILLGLIVERNFVRNVAVEWSDEFLSTKACALHVLVELDQKMCYQVVFVGRHRAATYYWDICL